MVVNMREDRIARPRPAAHVWRAAAATVRAFIEGIPAANAVKAMYPDDPITAIVMRAATTQATTGDPSWAGPLAALSVSEAIEDIVAMTAMGKLIASGALQVDMGRFASVVVPGRATHPADAGNWVQEGKPSPARQLTVLGPTLRAHKLEVIVTMTRELTEASNIEDVVRVLLTEAAGMALDAGVFSANPAPPAGILTGIAPLAPSAAGGFDSCGQDLGLLVGDIATRGGGARAAFVASPAQAIAIRFWAGGQFSLTPQTDVLPVAASAGLPAGTVVCVEPASFACTIGAPEFSASTMAAIHQEDTTPADIVSGGTPATPVKSMFQIDAIALKMTLWASWCMRAPHVSFMDTVAW
jgi:hypothetical protein